jgi:hypothetical protein
VVSNIAEGHNRHAGRAYLNHVNIALGSLAELDAPGDCDASRVRPRRRVRTPSRPDGPSRPDAAASSTTTRVRRTHASHITWSARVYHASSVVVTHGERRNTERRARAPNAKRRAPTPVY